MHIPDHVPDEVRTAGFAVVEGFLPDDELAAARVGLFEEFLTRDDDFADPERHRSIVRGAASRSAVAAADDPHPAVGRPRGGRPDEGGAATLRGLALHPAMHTLLVNATPRGRGLFGFPPPGHEYWNEETLIDAAGRWMGIDDLVPYGARPSTS
jgi:hypothetical protein